MTLNQADDHRPIVTAGTYDPEDQGETPHRTGGAEVVESTDLAEVRRTPYDQFARLSDEADVLRAKVDVAVQGILGA